MPKRCWIYDSGHGGVLGDEYTTFPKKMWTFDDGTTLLEGERNRTLVGFLMDLGDMDGLQQFDIVGGSMLDIPLAVRTNMANELNDAYPNCVYLSIHHNAGKGIGTEVFTSPGETASDAHAALLIDTLEENIEDFVLRPNLSGTGLDKEARFWVLTKTRMPSILLEVGFFDNWHDAKKIMDDEYLFDVAKAIHKYQLKAEQMDL